MNHVLTGAIAAAAFCASGLLFTTTASADNAAGANAADQRQWVTTFRGKPPFKRRRVEAPTPAAEQFAAAEPSEPRQLQRIGPPGKNRVITRNRAIAPTTEIASFARFEEDPSAADPVQRPKRQTRGAPGKSNPALRNW